jgi:hypothetical protein
MKIFALHLYDYTITTTNYLLGFVMLRISKMLFFVLLRDWSLFMAGVGAEEKMVG